MQLMAILEHLAFQHKQKFHLRMQMSRERGPRLKANQLHGSPIGFPKVFHLYSRGRTV